MTQGIKPVLEMCCARWTKQKAAPSTIKKMNFEAFQFMIHIPAPSKGCQMVPLQGGKIHHPLGFNWHPFEGAGIHHLFSGGGISNFPSKFPKNSNSKRPKNNQPTKKSKKQWNSPSYKKTKLHWRILRGVSLFPRVVWISIGRRLPQKEQLIGSLTKKGFTLIYIMTNYVMLLYNDVSRVYTQSIYEYTKKLLFFEFCVFAWKQGAHKKELTAQQSWEKPMKPVLTIFLGMEIWGRGKPHEEFENQHWIILLNNPTGRSIFKGKQISTRWNVRKQNHEIHKKALKLKRYGPSKLYNTWRFWNYIKL